jgi:cystathionine beta-lyase
MTPDELSARIAKDAGIAANAGPTFGLGGEGWMRFNLATPRSRVAEAVDRLHAAFKDVQ